jgi:hypothetical protein
MTTQGFAVAALSDGDPILTIVSALRRRRDSERAKKKNREENKFSSRVEVRCCDPEEIRGR